MCENKHQVEVEISSLTLSVGARQRIVDVAVDRWGNPTTPMICMMAYIELVKAEHNSKAR
jgi:hypothetical protein